MVGLGSFLSERGFSGEDVALRLQFEGEAPSDLAYEGYVETINVGIDFQVKSIYRCCA